MEELSLNFELPGARTLRIDATRSAMHPEQCTFRASEPLYPDSSAWFGEREQSRGSPLVDNLFAIDGVADVLVNHDVVRLSLVGDADWDAKIPLVGMAIRDALASGAPLVAARVGGLAETLRSGENALCFEAGDAGDLAQCVLEVLANPGLAARIAEGGRRLFEQRCAPAAVAGEVLGFYGEVLERRSAVRARAGSSP